MCSSTGGDVEKKLKEWRRAIDEIRRTTTVVLRFTGDGDSDMYIHRRTWEGNTHSTVRMETLGSVQYYQGFGVIEESSFYKTMVRQAMVYGSETWAVKPDRRRGSLIWRKRGC